MELTERKREIIALIGIVRDEHHSCTASEVATRLQISKSYLSEVMHEMKGEGLVSWSDGVPGSVIALVDVDGNSPSQASLSCAVCGWPDEKALAGHTNAKHRVAGATTSKR